MKDFIEGHFRVGEIIPKDLRLQVKDMAEEAEVMCAELLMIFQALKTDHDYMTLESQSMGLLQAHERLDHLKLRVAEFTDDKEKDLKYRGIQIVVEHTDGAVLEIAENMLRTRIEKTIETFIRHMEIVWSKETFEDLGVGLKE